MVIDTLIKFTITFIMFVCNIPSEELRSSKSSLMDTDDQDSHTLLAPKGKPRNHKLAEESPVYFALQLNGVASQALDKYETFIVCDVIAIKMLIF